MTPLGELLAERIRRYGPMTFAEYMRECLYHPVHGYYSKAEAKRFVDYYTSVDVHPIFARLLARRFAGMWESLDAAEGEVSPFPTAETVNERPMEDAETSAAAEEGVASPVTIKRQMTLVEAGAGVGRLAAHVLDFCEAKLPEFYGALRYVAVERSAARREQAMASCGRHAAAGHFVAAAEVPARISAGCVFSNELVDALPVHRVVVLDGALKEISVDFRDGKFVDAIAPLSTCAITEYFSAQNISLTEGQQAEAGLEACDWIGEIGRRLKRGYVLTIDYGHPAVDLFDEHHMRGTLLAYRNHRVSEDYYAVPGEQDLTAHVNFTALETWGKRSGLEKAEFTSQTAFLMALGQPNEFADLYDDEGQTEAEKVRARLQLKTLIHPEGMGERFQMLIQKKE